MVTLTAAVIHQVTCPHCGGRYDAMSASWCSCVSKDRALLCPLCLRCFCAAPATFKTAFWDRAPAELWQRRHAIKRAEPAFSNPDPAEVKRPLVMIVDDDKAMRAILVARIQALGYGAITAQDGAEGLLLGKLYRPDLVLTDALMPKMDGREMARRLREQRPGLHIVIMTAVYTGGQHKQEALRDFGADDYMTKPIDGVLLAEVLERHLC
jgi:CheY-like chemotaxis protein